MGRASYLILVGILLSACGTKSKGRNDAPNPNGPTGGSESLGDWERLSTNVTANLNSVTSVWETGIIAVGDGGTVIVSADEGKTWATKDVGTTSNLYRIAYVNSVVYIGGDNIVLISRDKGNNFVRAGSVEGEVRDIDYQSSNSKPGTFWAVGTNGLVLKAETGVKAGDEVEGFEPASLVWG